MSITEMIKRFLTLFSRRKRAARLGIKFRRAATFRIPGNIIICKKDTKLNLPLENGVKVAFLDILLDDCYCLERISSPVKTVLDIGAHAGLFGIAARINFPGALIHSYEPNPNLEKYIKVQADGADFIYFPEAVGLNDDRASLDLHPDSVRTRSRTDASGDITQIAFQRTIERLGGHADMLKIDCEGAEWQLLQDRTSWELVRNLSMEYHLWPDHTHEEIKDVLERLGFSIIKHLPFKDFGLIIANRLEQ
jgi:FkbM family methyltransferase